jgi:hypothetical protein
MNDPLQDAYDRTPVDGIGGAATPADVQELEGFKAVVTTAQIWEAEGLIKILDLHRESQTTNRLVDFIRFRRLK